MKNLYGKARRLAVVSSVSMIALGAGAALAQETTEAGADGARWSAHGSVTARAGTERHIGELDLFLPLWQSDSSMLYGDLRAQTDDAGNQEGNVGLGFRNMGEDWVLGGYGFFDYRKSDETGNSFMQGTLGVEALSDTLDLRANVYVPEGGEQAAPGATLLRVIGGSLQMRAGFERALPGFDGEVGYRLWGSRDGGMEVRAFAGGYYFDAADYRTVAGPRGRVEARLFDLGFLGEGSRFTLGAEVTQDNVRDTQGFAVARLTIPFGGGRRSGQGGLNRRMTDYVVRDVDIITRAAATGAAEAVTFVGLTGNVTVLTAADDLVAATANGAINDVFIVDGSAGAFNTTASIALQDGQNLLGGRDFAVVGVDSGARATYAGARPTINGDVAGGAVVTLASNATVADIDIENISTLDYSYGITGNAVTGASVTGSGITTNGNLSDAVYLAWGGSNTISNNNIVTHGGTDALTRVYGINLYGGGGISTISGNSITMNGNGIGVMLLSSTGATISGNDVAINGFGMGINIIGASNDNTVSGNNIATSDAGGIGIALDHTSTNNIISDNIITTQSYIAYGVYLGSSGANTVSGNSITTNGTQSYGVYLVSGVSTVSGNSITTGGGAAHGVMVSGSSSNTINDNVIATGLADAAGVFLTDPSATGVDWNTGVGNSYTGSGSACTVDASVTGTNNSIDLCP